MKEKVLNYLDNVRTEFIIIHHKDSVSLYDFEDSSYIEDITDYLDDNNIKYKAKRSSLDIFVKD